MGTNISTATILGRERSTTYSDFKILNIMFPKSLIP